ncbi:MAG: hypothetical protein ACI8PZ_003443 [Myxococcota bacterium]|jgi:hypothetical protein
MPILPVALLACSLLSASGDTAVPWDATEVPESQAVRPPPVLTVFVPDALHRGAAERIDVHGAAAGETVYLVAAGGAGPGPCHRGIGGRCLGVTPPIVRVQEAPADDDGIASFVLLVPDRLEDGLEIATQALIVRGFSGADTVLSDAKVMPVAPPDTGERDTGGGDCLYDTAVPPGDPGGDPAATWGFVRELDTPVTDALLAFDHHHATIEVQSDGSFLVAWDEGEPPFARVKASLLDADGAFVRNDFFVGYLAEYVPGRPDVAPRTSGGWFVAYGNAADVYVVQFDETGTEVTRTAPVNEASGTAEFQGMPDLAVDGDGAGFTILYMFGDDDLEPRGRYYIRRFGEDLEPLSEEELIATSTLDPSPPDAATVGDGVGLVWSQRAVDCADGELATIRAQRLDGAGERLGAPFRVDQGDLSEPPSRPVIAGTDAGWYAVAWRAQDASRDGVGTRLRFFDPAGRPMGDARELEVERAENGNRPVVDIAGEVLVVAWEEWTFVNDLDVYVQAFDVTSGDPLTEPERVNVERSLEQERPDVAIRQRDDGTFDVYVTYEGVEESAPSLREVRATRWHLAPL